VKELKKGYKKKISKILSSYFCVTEHRALINPLYFRHRRYWWEARYT